MKFITDEQLEEITRSAVTAALDKIDESTNGTTNCVDGPCGDALASKLHKLIKESLDQHYEIE